MQREWTMITGEALEVIRTRVFETPQGDTEYHRVKVTSPQIDSEGVEVLSVGTVFDLTTEELRRNEAF